MREILNEYWVPVVIGGIIGILWYLHFGYRRYKVIDEKVYVKEGIFRKWELLEKHMKEKHNL